MRRIDLRVDELVVETHAEASQAPRLREVFRDAFFKLAERLRKAAGARDVSLQSLALERLEVSTLAPDVLLGPGGAEALAEALYRQIVKGAA